MPQKKKDRDFDQLPVHSMFPFVQYCAKTNVETSFKFVNVNVTNPEFPRFVFCLPKESDLSDDSRVSICKSSDDIYHFKINIWTIVFEIFVQN